MPQTYSSTMANRHPTTVSAPHKTSLSNRPPNQNARKAQQRGKISTVSEMSPEARRAILLAREDSKVNNKNNSRKKTDTLSPRQDRLNDTDDSTEFIDPNNNSTIVARQKEHQNVTRGFNLNTNTSLLSTRSTTLKNPKLSTPSSTSRPPRIPKIGTARSRSTISQNEPPFSMSDNNEISSHMGTNTTSNASVYTSNLSTGNNNHSHFNTGNSSYNKNPNNLTDVNTADDDDNDSALPNDDSFDEDEEEDADFNKDSFVVALDKALEKSYVSRLKGDITDTARVTKPGTVRALNGGRLTNAQEVVVNVCHNDDTELVFHDDDDESIDTAKAISEIRVNIWMEYNSRFPPDNNLNDFDHGSSNTEDTVDCINKQKKLPSSEMSKYNRRLPSASGTSKPREKSAAPNDRTSVAKRLTGGGSVKTGASTSNSGQTNNLSLRNIPQSPTTSRKSSAASSRGKVNSANSSAPKPTTPLKTKR